MGMGGGMDGMPDEDSDDNEDPKKEEGKGLDDLDSPSDIPK